MDSIRIRMGGIKIKNGSSYQDIDGLYAGTASNDFIVNLPSKIYATVGRELNIFYDNLVSTHDYEYSFDVFTNDHSGMMLDRCWRFTPTSTDVGTKTLTVVVTDHHRNKVTRTATLYVSAATANSNSRNILILGDSTTANDTSLQGLSTVCEHLKDDYKNASGSKVLTLQGTIGASGYLNEGRPGWGFVSYCTNANPFLNNGAFDAAHYFTGKTIPNWVFINLGINDILHDQTDAEAVNTINTIKSKISVMCSSFFAAGVTKIGLCLTTPPSYTQDPWGRVMKIYKDAGTDVSKWITRDRFKRNHAMLIRELLKTQFDPAIVLVPLYISLDTEYAMGIDSNARSAYDSTSVSEIAPNGFVHPSDIGYHQIADVYHSFLRANA